MSATNRIADEVMFPEYVVSGVSGREILISPFLRDGSGRFLLPRYMAAIITLEKSIKLQSKM